MFSHLSLYIKDSSLFREEPFCFLGNKRVRTYISETSIKKVKDKLSVLRLSVVINSTDKMSTPYEGCPKGLSHKESLGGGIRQSHYKDFDL